MLQAMPSGLDRYREKRRFAETPEPRGQLGASDEPMFVILCTYAIQSSALSLHFALAETMEGRRGAVTSGELVLVERSAGRVVSSAIFARWKGG